jgi:type IV pilus biogenesis protein CpaD/CtpE
VSIILKSASETLQQFGRAVAVVAVSAALAGCALDDFAKDDSFEPYGGSKQHPIKVVNGKASVEKCGDWSENVLENGDNLMMPNHGCAVQSNIAAMTAYPNDLVRARRMSRPPAIGRVAAVKKISGSSAGADSAAPASPTP